MESGKSLELDEKSLDFNEKSSDLDEKSMGSMKNRCKLCSVLITFLNRFLSCFAFLSMRFLCIFGVMSRSPGS